MTLLRFWLSHRWELAVLLQQHAALVLISTSLAVAVGIPAGVLAARRPRLGRTLVAVANIAQTIPSLALLGFLLPLPLVGGIGPRTALVALSIYALLPIMRTTMSGIVHVDPAVVEAGVAMGMTSRQLLLLVQLPLALPSIVAGVRVATVIGVGTARCGAIRAGAERYHFSQLIIGQDDDCWVPFKPLSPAGTRYRLARAAPQDRAHRPPIKPMPAATILLVAVTTSSRRPPKGDTIIVGSKNFASR